MLAKSQRLNLTTNFRWVASGKSLSTKNFKFFMRLGDNDFPRIGVSIVSAQFKKANLRNQAKRICFELARINYDKLRKNLNLVIMPKSSILEIDIKELEVEFNNALPGFEIN